MSTLVVDRSRRGPVARVTEERRLHEPRRAAGGGSTLEQMVSGVWEDLAARGLAACPVCGDEMCSRAGHGSPAVCRGCASELL